jgi:hypothetical protein
MAIQSQVSQARNNPFTTVAHVAATAVVAKVFGTANLHDPTRITYIEFGRWYNEGGFSFLPWLELLDLSKWPSPTAAMAIAITASGVAGSAAATVASTEDGGSEGGSVEDAAGQAAEGGDDAVLVFPLGDEGDRLCVSAADIRHVHRVLEVSRFGRVEADDLYALFDSEAEGGKV